MATGKPKLFDCLRRKAIENSSCDGTSKNSESDVTSQSSSRNNSVTGLSNVLPLADEGIPQKRKKREKEKTVCKFEESPYYILKVAAQGNLEEVRRIVSITPDKLAIRDYRGQGVFHHAVTWSRIQVLDYLFDCTVAYPELCDIDLKDKVGNTPLHLAMERNQPKAVEWLLKHDVDLTIANNNSSAPIHLAIELNKLNFVEMIVQKSPDSAKMAGDFGHTPLHYACARDYADIAKYLLDNGANLFQNNSIGYSAIHAATRAGAAKTVDVLIGAAEEMGISGETLIHTLDDEKNLPLHSAVNSGDLRAVMVCLKAGADINAQHLEDKQSAVHYAATKGRVDILKTMFESSSDLVENSLQVRDVLDQTPLHKASMFNHLQAVELLVEQGASVNVQDAERRTPLVLAASKGAVKVANYLLKRRANVSLRDKDNRNFLHMAILTGVRIRDFELTNVRNLKQLLNEKDDFGCTSIHYASKAGQLKAVQSLLEHGAEVTLKDNDKQSALHFAAKHGRLRTCKKLLKSEHGALLINEVDSEGRTPLQIAAIYGHFRVISLLARKGAQMNRDFNQNTALHMAAEYGNHESVVMLVGLAPHLLNAVNTSGNTALHLAALNGHAVVVDYLMTAGVEFSNNNEGASFFDLAIVKYHSDAAATIIKHQRCEEAMQLKSILGAPIVGLVQFLPKICILFLDKCITYSAENNKSREFFVNYDFRYLRTPENMFEEAKLKNNKTKLSRIIPLDMMVKFNRVECLAHPLTVKFLDRKWMSYGSILYNVRLLLYAIFLVILTVIGMEIDERIAQIKCEFCHESQISVNSTDQALRAQQNRELHAALGTEEVIVQMVVLTVFALANLVVQFMSLYQQKLAYFFDFTHYLELTLYICTFCMVVPTLSNNDKSSVQFPTSVIAVFLGWINFLLYLQRFDFFGIYVVMFVEIFKTVIRVFIVFSFIIVAFGLSLTVVFRTIEGPTVEFINPGISIVATLSMMLGELNYVNVITPTVDGTVHLLYPSLTYTFYVIFIILIPILLTNLLVGLAVGNIESVQKNARLKRLAMKVDFFTGLERRLPMFILKRSNQDEFRFYPNKAGFRAIEKIRTVIKQSTTTGAGDQEELGGIDADNEGSKSEFAYLLEELTLQSRNLTGLGNKFENQQEMLKQIMLKLDAELSNKDPKDKEIESGGEDEQDQQKHQAMNREESTEFHSAAARAQWHAVTTRFAAFRKPRMKRMVSQGDSSDDDSQSGRRGVLKKRESQQTLT